MTLETEILALGQSAKAASAHLRLASGETRECGAARDGDRNPEGRGA